MCEVINEISYWGKSPNNSFMAKHAPPYTNPDRKNTAKISDKFLKDEYLKEIKIIIHEVKSTTKIFKKAFNLKMGAITEIATPTRLDKIINLALQVKNEVVFKIRKFKNSPTSIVSSRTIFNLHLAKGVYHIWMAISNLKNEDYCQNKD